MIDFIIFILSLSALIKGADLVVKEAERIALKFDIPEFIIGASLIAFGTSLPEMAASISATLNNKPEMAVGNVIGSVIFNITLVLGLVFLLSKKIEPKRDIFAKDSAWSLIPIFTFILIVYDNKITRFEGMIFIILMFSYLYFLSKENIISEEIDEDLKKEPLSWPKTIIFLLIGFILVIVGAEYTIESASNLAKSFGVSEWVISLILIALGTSLPELVVSIVASLKNKGEMAIGNIIGSNVANFTMVLGSASIVKPLNINISEYSFDILTALIVSILLIFITANKMYNKSAGIALLSILALFLCNSI